MRRWIIVPLLVAVSQQALASRGTPGWDRSNTLACTVVSAEICRYPGGNKTCTPAQASFDSVKIDYGKSQVNLLAAGMLHEAWTIIGISRSEREAAAVQFVRSPRHAMPIPTAASAHKTHRAIRVRGAGSGRTGVA